jgi:hypothetical protein
MHMHILPNHSSYSMVWLFLGVAVAPTAVLSILFLIAHYL